MYHLPPHHSMLLRPTGPSFDPNAAAYFAAGSITSPVEQAAANTFILALKANGLWDGLDCIYLCSPTSASAALLCAKTLSSMVAVASPTFSTNGFLFNGTSQYLNTNQNLALQTAFQQNSACIGTYLRTLPAANQAYFGARQTTSIASWLWRNPTGHLFALNGPSSIQFNTPPVAGLTTIIRNNSSTMQWYTRTTLGGNSTFSSNSRPSVSLFFNAINESGSSVSNFSGANWAGGFFGAALTVPQLTIMDTLWQAYQTALGRAV